MFAEPKFKLVYAMPERPLNVTHMETVVHIGTHVDAPRHFCIDGPTMEEVPLDRLKGRGVVIRINRPRHGIVEPMDLEAAEPGIEPGDIICDQSWMGGYMGKRGESILICRWTPPVGWSTSVLSSSPLIPRRPTFRASVGRRILIGRFTEPCCATVF
jgi:hypothetical protein